MLKWQDVISGETGGDGETTTNKENDRNWHNGPASPTIDRNWSNGILPQSPTEGSQWSKNPTSPVGDQNWHNGNTTHPASPQRSLSSHDDQDQDINSRQTLLVSNRAERSKVCKSTSALCSLLSRWSRSKPDITHTLSNSSTIYQSSGALFQTPSHIGQSSGALFHPSNNIGQNIAMRRCQTLVSLSPESPPRHLPIHPYNRLRPQSRLCSRCSSLLSMASSSKYTVNEGRYVSLAEPSSSPTPTLSCKLCLTQVPVNQMYTLQCSCQFCLECTQMYVEFEVNQGAYEISCPDAMCKSQGIINLRQIENLVNSDTYQRHLRFRKNKEVDSDSGLAWCPGVGCETVCTVLEPGGPTTCPTCSLRFCSVCRGAAHFETACPRLTSGPPPPFLTFDSDLIKYCPMCSVPIEKDEGCAQMMCKRCKHVFCWYCLASLDDDFLLRHYDKGPCKNKLGHSRASVIWHRTQVIGIFAGFGILLLVASPLLLLAAPCIVCCKCRVCTGGDSRVEDDVTPVQPNEESPPDNT